ncbi:hypothetical protein PRIC1_000271 [Phytophthora ramorum]
MPRTTHKDREGPAQPTEWMIDLYRFVQHPTYDFQASSCQLVNHFRVRMPWHTAERAIEAAFWSKDVDWASTVSSTDLYATVLRQIFDALCRSHPPAFGVDSVKFSKLLYEAKIQPSMLGIGDAAFLFASNITPGFTYEMDFDGFVRAVEWLSQQFYADTATKVKTSPSKALPGIQHAMMKWQLSRKRERKHQERESEQRGAKLTRERQLIVMVQTHLRQNLARKIRQQLALSSYSKHFDRESGRFLYVLQYQSGNRVVLGERKPFSLFDKDVPLPPDEWQLESASDNNISFFNPRRGVYSRYNNILAATAIQRWFRGKMWNGVNNWKLRDTVHALRYQNNVQKPTNMADAGELENLKRYGLQLHAMLHQVHHLSFARVGVFAV